MFILQLSDGEAVQRLLNLVIKNGFVQISRFISSSGNEETNKAVMEGESRFFEFH